MHKIDRFTVIASQRDVLFAWAPSSHLARIVHGHLYVERSQRTQQCVEAVLRSVRPAQYIPQFSPIGKRYGDLLLALQRDSRGAVSLDDAKEQCAAVLAAVDAAIAGDGLLPHLPRLNGGTAALAPLVTDWRAAALLDHPGQWLFPDPSPPRYAF